MKYSECELKDLTLQDCNERLAELCEKFSYYMTKIYPEGIPKIEKGDRLACDGYLILASDIIRYMTKIEHDEARKASYSINQYFIMEWYEEHSRWNFDLTLRQAELYSSLFLVEDCDELFKIKDLKGNQYDTLSHIFYRNHIKVGLLNEQSNCFRKTYNFYQLTANENQQVISPNFSYFKAVSNCTKECNLKTIQEFYLYDTMNKNSVFRTILDLKSAEA